MEMDTWFIRTLKTWQDENFEDSTQSDISLWLKCARRQQPFGRAHLLKAPNT